MAEVSSTLAEVGVDWTQIGPKTVVFLEFESNVFSENCSVRAFDHVIPTTDQKLLLRSKYWTIFREKVRLKLKKHVQMIKIRGPL